MFLYNSLTRKKEEFKPINLPAQAGPSQVGIYTCGPTVYNFVHIGNLRAYIFYDILKRVLLQNGFSVNHVMNITDVDDKIIKGAKEEGLEIGKFSEKYTKAFFDDLEALNILPATHYPKATEYIPQIIELINTLLKKEFAYKAEDDSIYFSISKFSDYGKLSGLDKRSLKTGTRVLADEYEKENVQDFALWKATREGEPSWDAPFGAGRPGWHIECSAMSLSLIGETLDIHSGGVDLLFPHHENEIAQSEAATGKKFSNYWTHNEHLLVDGKKMSKSLHNFYTLKDIEGKGLPAGRQGVDPLALRYLYLTAHYRDPLNFTWESLEAAQSALERLRQQFNNLTIEQSNRTALSEDKLSKIDDYRKRFLESLNNDLNTPQALAVVWEVVKSNIPDADKRDLLLSFDEVLGLNLVQTKQVVQVDQAVQELLEQRKALRKEGKFDEADEVRRNIENKGYKIEDTPEGARVKEK